MLRHGARSYPGLRTYVFSRTLKPAEYPEVTILGEDGEMTVRWLRSESGKDIWLSGGGELFRSLLAAGLVDTVEVGISPIVLGSGRAFLPSPGPMQKLKLAYERAFPSGLLVLYYDVVR
jgi:dihydrofolate reductase